MHEHGNLFWALSTDTFCQLITLLIVTRYKAFTEILHWMEKYIYKGRAVQSFFPILVARAVTP